MVIGTTKSNGSDKSGEKKQQKEKDQEKKKKKKKKRKSRKKGGGVHENFFCSELVAAALKEAGLMRNEKSSCNYWPGDFGDGGAIEEVIVDPRDGMLRAHPSDGVNNVKGAAASHVDLNEVVELARSQSSQPPASDGSGEENGILGQAIMINCRFMEVGFAIADDDG
jgi:hypothetical protein